MSTGTTGTTASTLVDGDILWAFQQAGFTTKEQVAAFLKICKPMVNAQILSNKAERIRQRSQARQQKDEADIQTISAQAATYQDALRVAAETADPIA